MASLGYLEQVSKNITPFSRTFTQQAIPAEGVDAQTPILTLIPKIKTIQLRPRIQKPCRRKVLIASLRLPPIIDLIGNRTNHPRASTAGGFIMNGPLAGLWAGKVSGKKRLVPGLIDKPCLLAIGAHAPEVRLLFHSLAKLERMDIVDLDKTVLEDISFEDHPERQARVQRIRADAIRLPSKYFSPESYDLIYLGVEVTAFLDDDREENMRALAAKVTTLLRPGGTIILNGRTDAEYFEKALSDGVVRRSGPYFLTKPAASTGKRLRVSLCQA
jgi:hypothetical protein